MKCEICGDTCGRDLVFMGSVHYCACTPCMRSIAERPAAAAMAEERLRVEWIYQRSLVTGDECGREEAIAGLRDLDTKAKAFMADALRNPLGRGSDG